MHNYSSGYKLLAAAFILAFIGILLAYIFSSCKTIEKKTAKAYKEVASYDPLTSIDSTNFYKRAKTMIKPVPPKIVKGQTIRVPYPVDKIKKILDTVTQKKLIDSLTEVFKAYEKYNEEDCSRQVKEALETGYKQAQYEEYINGKEVTTPDSLFFPDPSTVALLDEANLRLRTSEAERIKVTAERDVFKKQSGSKNYWIAGLLLALGGLAFFKIKSLLSPKKAAETINNIV